MVVFFGGGVKHEIILVRVVNDEVLYLCNVVMVVLVMLTHNGGPYGPDDLLQQAKSSLWAICLTRSLAPEAGT